MSSSPLPRPPFIANPICGHALLGIVPLVMSFSVYNPQDATAIVLAKAFLALGVVGFVMNAVHWLGVWRRWWGN